MKVPMPGKGKADLVNLHSRTDAAWHKPESVMTNHLISLGQIQKECTPIYTGTRPYCMASYEELYSFLLQRLKATGPKRPYNADLVEFVERSLKELPQWDKHECLTQFRTMRALMETKSRKKHIFREACFEYVYSIIRVPFRYGMSFDRACTLLIDYLGWFENYFTYEMKGDLDFLAGTERLEREFHIRVWLPAAR
jgi:hypothetical protein